MFITTYSCDNISGGSPVKNTLKKFNKNVLPEDNDRKDTKITSIDESFRFKKSKETVSIVIRNEDTLKTSQSREKLILTGLRVLDGMRKPSNT